MGEQYNAYEELGGNTPSELTSDKEQALYDQGYGDKGFRARIEARNRDAQYAEKLIIDAAQNIVDKAGGEENREAMIAFDKAKGIDTDSQEYRLMLIRENRHRTRHS
ncbi:MAG: hypothetical protein JWO54_282 [Candidatus Saccharibacteria bacterium]|jgi:hypothetical protein|nr:hypothetical protein [Candidatus Saccharibacteria bacterium]MDB5180524.1 hypothetical protein [Candidatus Saccharibacteria bacterium]